MPKQNAKKRLASMTAEELAEATKEFDEEFVMDKSRPLSRKGRLLWQRAQKAGKKEQRDGTKAVTVRLDEALLKKSDEYAREQGMTRDELINRSLKGILAFVERS
jgi:hypothetical protein